MKTKIFLLALLIIELAARTAFAGPVQLLGDLNQVKSRRSYPFSAQSGTKIFFSRTTDAGTGLWTTDGTVAGTQAVKIFTASAGSVLADFHPATFSGTAGVYFLVVSQTYGLELWKSDGTEAGTTIVKDINPGAASGLSSGGNGSLPEILVFPNSATAVFAADDGTHGKELWMTDGTSGGTVMIDDLRVGSGGSNPENLFAIGSFVLFTATDGTTGEEPYLTNGSVIVQLLDVRTGASDSSPDSYTLAGSKIVFAANDGTHGKELWQTPIFGSTTIVSDITAGTESSYIFGLTSFSPISGALFASVSAGLGAGGSPLINMMRTDGTPGGTSVIAPISCIPGGLYSLYVPGVLKIPRVVNNHLVFPCYNILTTESEPWVSDGTSDSTHILKDVFAGGGSSGVTSFMPGNNLLVFTANDAVHGSEPWVTDGTSAGTAILADLNPGEASSTDTTLGLYSLYSQTEAATASILPVTIGKRAAVYYTDGTLANTRELFDDSKTDANNSSSPYGFTAIGSRVVFAATHTSKGTELYVTNGTKPGTSLLKNLFKSGDSAPTDFRALTDKLVFVAADVSGGTEIWRTDGTAANTKRVKDIYPGGVGSAPKMFKGLLKKRALFSADDGTHGIELWSTNGSASGTKMIKDIAVGATSSIGSDLVVKGNRAYFDADDGVNGQELWVTDGTEAGTTMLADIMPGSSGSYPANKTSFNGNILFSASDGSSGTELWISDGTSGGTHLLKDINPGAGSSLPTQFVKSGSYMFFLANSGLTGQELWRTDGTSDGTILIQDIYPGSSTSAISGITPAAGGKVVFSATDGTNGYEPWVAGSAAGSASMLSNISTTGNSYPSDFYRVPGKKAIYFAAFSETVGTELYRTDGTAAHTVLVKNINPDTAGSSPANFYYNNGKLYFSAYTNAKGKEPYVLKLD